ncbi:MAG: hypothetical protein ACRDTE_31970 [Pseudonocardiaceae bacterium]
MSEFAVEVARAGDAAIQGTGTVEVESAVEVACAVESAGEVRRQLRCGDWTARWSLGAGHPAVQVPIVGSPQPVHLE